MSLFRTLRRFQRNESGAMAVLLILILPALLIVGGIATDVTLLNAQKQHLQRQVDLAATAGAQHISEADAASRVARSIFNRNGRCTPADSNGTACNGEQLVRAVPYHQNGSTWEAAPTPRQATALFVEGEARFRPILLGPVLSEDNLVLRRSAIAQPVAKIDSSAVFTLRNRLLRVQTANSLLGALLEPLGVALTVDVLGTSGLVSAGVKLNDLLGLATASVGAEVLGFNNLLDVPIKLNKLLGLILYDTSKPKTEQTLLSGVTWGGIGFGGASGTGVDRTVTLREILDMPATLARVRVGDVLPDIKLGVLDVLSTVAQLGSNDSQRLGVNLDLKLISDRILALKVGLGLIRSQVMALRAPGPSDPPQLSLAQTHLYADLKLLSLLHLSLSLKVAGADASLTYLNCEARPGTDDLLASFAVRTRPLEVRLRLNLFYTLQAEAIGAADTTADHIPLLADSTFETLTFTQREYESGLPKTFQSPIKISTLVPSLLKVLSDLTADTRKEETNCLLRPLTCLKEALDKALDLVVASTTKALLEALKIDTVVNNLLKTLGLQVASAEVQLNGVHCNTRPVAAARLVH